MECLTPPLDSVPVEEWFCPECEANNLHTSKYFALYENSDRKAADSIIFLMIIAISH